ncbi:hypothetical protein EJ110_NYTH29089 [Nymphaea thermarum]|nr:hypothetical protein EJ110_NYTH29089 [Nymphaea thermarum]
MRGVAFFGILILVSFFFNEAPGNITAMFLFGDSVVDDGNNVYLPDSDATANFLPYGIDLEVPTESLGLPHRPPCFKDPTTKGTKIFNEVNHASAGSSILDSTTFNVKETLEPRSSLFPIF